MTVLMAMPQQMMADDIAINETNFPDENFRNWVLAQDYGQDGVLTEAEIAEVTFIYVESEKIINLKGIEHFIALTQLYCHMNQLSSLDVSKNTALTTLWCHANQLTSLDVSKNTALTELYCEQNLLTSLDVSKNTALRVFDCHENQLTALDVSKNTALTGLSCEYNKLTSLEVSKNTTLNYLNCGYNQLTSLDVSKNTALIMLVCNSNLLTSLDVSKNTELKSLYCDTNQIKGAAMDALIAGLPSAGGEFYAISPDDNSEQNVVTKAQVAAAKTKSWTVYYFTDNSSEWWKEYEGSEPASGGIAIDAKNFPDENFRNWVLAQDYGQDGVLTEDEIAGVTNIDVSWKNIASLKGIEYFTALTELKCGFNQLTSLDLSKNTALTKLECDANLLTFLDVSKNMALTNLNCSYNQLTSLYLPQNTALTWLGCSNNQLSLIHI